ncbi:vacuolar protein sorting-associated protein 27 [Ricinus communis]|uniref:Zinc finger protein, putative n=1 Tax=Ricinus communis TaxID=3988 RepID=B9RR08_RICCO|nr:vacuolar protein sorting-associated protein 27 [Ricinus communis]EEF46179.1 zinc finger protein, putative [Ricinus communis]|eukprot:XP_002516177.1 vacuolar protein sorting-associated protein 27 [Ricinus communis]
MAAIEPPPFHESDRCDVCKCSFSTFRRRHHCRRCGRTLCHEHSSNQMALPQFGILSNVRVCADCFNDSTRSGQTKSHASSDGAHSVTDKFSRLDIGAETYSTTETATQSQSVTGAIECKCGMPLCICEAPAPIAEAVPLQMKTPSSSMSQSNPKPKKTDANLRNRVSSSNNKPSSVFNHGQTTNGSSDSPQMDYEVNGEGLREAIKNGDTAAVKKLLSEGVDANYRDKQGLSLLHLAALFNRTDIAFILMESGASLAYKNAQGETPLDCAPATLQYKMKKKMEEHGQQGPQTTI